MSWLLCLLVQYCGSCWIHGALAAANDRIKVLMDGRHDVMLARQVLLNCGASKGLGAGCDGGECQTHTHTHTHNTTQQHYPPTQQSASHTLISLSPLSAHCSTPAFDVFEYMTSVHSAQPEAHSAHCSSAAPATHSLTAAHLASPCPSVSSEPSASLSTPPL